MNLSFKNLQGEGNKPYVMECKVRAGFILFCKTEQFPTVLDLFYFVFYSVEPFTGFN